MFRLREARRADLDVLTALRNDPASVRYSKRGVLSREEVARDYLGRADKHAFLATRGGAPVGYAIFEKLGDGVGEISVALAPAHRGKRLARPLIEAASALAAGRLGCVSIWAEIDADNTASRRAFLGAGYRRVGSAKGAGGLERYELKCASPRSAADPHGSGRGPARQRPAPPPPD